MLQPFVASLNSKKIVLASASPRRSELLRQIGLKFEVVVSTFDEKLPHSQFPSAAAYACETARFKALEVATLCGPGGASCSGRPADIVIGADTVVELGGNILEKPDDEEHAYRMLSSLSGGTHNVHTAVVMVLPQASDPSTGKPPYVHSFASTTRVTFDELTPDMLRCYIESGEPFGKAGSYGIQGLGGSFVKSLDGCYFTVMGFPLHRFCSELLGLVQRGYIPLSSVGQAPQQQ